ncbi:MAG: DUF748 domain-containing protein [Myxococcales bacterium]|nr:DUF748 domain-containing protein [Myxococcales bacterium]
MRHRKLLITLAIIAGVLIAGRIALNPFVAHHTQQVLDSLKGYRGSFEDVAVSLYKLSYTIDGLKLVQVPTPPGASEKRPFFYAKRIEIGLHWRDLIHKHELVGSAELDGPKLNLIAGPSKSKSQTKIADPELGEKIKHLSPLAVERIELKRAEVAFTDDTSHGSPSIWVHDLDATLENVATRVGLSHGEPTTLAASGTLQKTGQVSVFLTADPLAKKLGFSGRAAVEHLALKDVGNFLVKKAALAPQKGSIDLFAEFDAHDGVIAGGVKPILKDVEVKPAKGGFMPALKAWIADAALHVFSDRVPGRNATAAVIPMEGTINGPKPQLWPTIWGVLRNAFVAGLESGFARLPAGKPAEKGVLPQARNQPRKRG